jgi:hypothetical protein
MQNGGGNGYKIFHIGKAKLARARNLPTSICSDPELILQVVSSLNKR